MKAPLKPLALASVASTKELREWSKTEMARGVPRGAVLRYLASLSNDKAFSLSERLFDPMVTRNLKGKEHERAGNIAQAVKQYEANVAEEFPGSHPYDRLARIYAHGERWEDVKRVSDAFFTYSEGRDDVRQFFEKKLAEAASHLPPSAQEASLPTPPLPPAPDCASSSPPPEPPIRGGLWSRLIRRGTR